MRRVVIASIKSGGGKTTFTCGLIRALKNRGLKVLARKCGPDYIDPMFHRKVLDVSTGNLDSYFTDDEMLRYLLMKDSYGCDIGVIEGVMGYYDGLGGTGVKASTYDVSRITESPVILVVDAKGASVTLAAMIRGILDYKEDNRIKGIVLNRVSEGFYERIADLIREECKLPVLGYLPELKEAEIGSRHLGLLQPSELEDPDKKLDVIAGQLEKTVDVNAIIGIAEGAGEIGWDSGFNESLEDTRSIVPEKLRGLLESYEVKEIRDKAPLIAVAGDSAFGFYYDDNIRLLKELGARIEYFSPLEDKKLPDGISGIILYGGYPEEYAEELSSNVSMRGSIKKAHEEDIPIIAECGGFMYLMDTLEDREGKAYPMCGVIKGRAYYTGRLVRFGYMEAVAKRDGLYGKAGLSFRGHEFHHYDCSFNGSDFTACKAGSDKSYDCMIHTDKLAAGFPHIYAYANPSMYLNFLRR